VQASLDASEQLNSVSCPTRGYCVAAGSVNGTGYAIVPVTVTLLSGHWQHPTETPAPPATGIQDQLNSISVTCVAAGDCVAVGGAFGGTLPTYGFMWTESGGHWSSPRIAGVPANADYPGGFLVSVGCTALPSCVAVGYYVHRGGNTALQVDRTSGIWRRGVSDNINNTATTLNAISCTRWLCVAVGKYYQFARSLAVTNQRGGLLGHPVDIALPPNAMQAQPNNGQVTQLTAVSCLGRGWCAAVGSYIDKADNPVAMVTIRS
jgi:hypothetical protein